MVLDHLDPRHEYIQHRLFRESCVQTEEGVYVKDLRVLANRDLNNVILVDNAAYSFGFQIENGIPILPFYDNYNDKELKILTEYLKSLADSKNIREHNAKTFKLRSLQEYDTPEDGLVGVFGVKYRG
jgi:CTD small phosphatase-like protein 2